MSSSLRQTLHDRGHGVFRSSDSVESVVALGVQEGWRTVEFELHGLSDKTGLLERAAKVFDLPDWFGANWDALADCLTDVVAEPGVLVVVRDGDTLPPKVRRTALEILGERAGDEQDPFVVVVVPK